MAINKQLAYAILGTAAAGVGIGVVYYYYTTKNQQQAELAQLEAQLEQIHVTWLDTIASKYTQGDTVKALHKLIQHCQTTSNEKQGAEKIFKTIRCNTCGEKSKVAFTAQLSQHQIDFLDAMGTQFEISAGRDKVLRILFEYVINDAEESVVFAS